MTAENIIPQSHMGGDLTANITTTDEFPTHNADNPVSAQNTASIASQKQDKSGKPEGGKKKKGTKNTTPVPSKSATPAPPETTSQYQQYTSSDTQLPGPDQNPTSSTTPMQDETIPVQSTSARPTLSMETSTVATKDGHAHMAHGSDSPDGNPYTPPPPFEEVATPIEPTLLTQEQTDRESLRGEFLMRELKHLEVLVAKAETGVGRGSPSALSVERLNGIKEKLVRVRMRVDRRIYEGDSVLFGLITMLTFLLCTDAPTEFPTPPQLTLSGIDGSSAVDLVHTAIVDMLLETPHAELLELVGYINKQRKTTLKAVETKTAVVDWVKESVFPSCVAFYSVFLFSPNTLHCRNKFKVRNEHATPFILNITF
jgi:hypothetical protein